jgi:methionyl-tRNA synthetase
MLPRRRTVIIGPPPTPNGDLHIGHMAGPYVAADVHARYLRAVGREVLYATGTDDSQTYVVASARRRGIAPEALCDAATRDIRRTLAAMGVAVDGFAPFDAGYRAAVLDFVLTLHAAGKLRSRTVRLPYSERDGEFLYEGLVCGGCPVCLAESRGGLCETCGHPIDVDGLLDPRSTVDPTDVVSLREATILVLAMEEYRERLVDYYATRQWRPHMAQLVREVLARPLPDFPITYPGTWGIAAPFPETPGQVLNAWAEGMPASMYCTAHADGHGAADGPADALWRADQAIELVYFLGFDNAYFWGMTHLALLMAHEGRYVLPETIVCNEFYELDNDKFSTSRGHVVWTRELLADVPRDLVRFHLALTAPEHQRTNFSRAALDEVTRQRLVDPWNRLAELLGDRGEYADLLPVSAAARTRAGLMIDRFAACYELAGYSLNRAADLIAVQLDRLERCAADAGDGECDAGDCYLETAALIACAAPILIDLAAAAAAAGAPVDRLSIAAFAVTHIAPFALPRLDRAPVPAVAALAAGG